MTPVPAASVILLRDAQPAFEVLMIRRHEGASFVPSMWVFAGGMVEQLDREIARERGDGSLLGRMRVAAARELFEETGVWLGAPLENADSKRRRLLAGNLGFRALLEESPIDFEQLVWTSHWITPAGIPKRFDTYFFLAKADANAVATVENVEAVDVRWLTPDAALRELQLVFPTVKNLEALRGFDSIEALIASRRGAKIEPVEPVLVNGKPALR
ncbi:MAG TPA: NUDIX hydrolase [Thermoanaerobaculia bacterium]|nr:NUDIX hydrolase [Thermoanaerobaculia bacterium]